MLSRHAIAAVLLGFFVHGMPAAAQEFKAGVAKVVITPENGLWMAGYAARNKPAEGKLTDLFAKALVLEDDAGHRQVLITSDLLGWPRSLSSVLIKELASPSLPSQAIMLTASHTHCGPVLPDSLQDMYDIDDAQRQKLDAYAKALIPKVVKLVQDAIADLKPVKLSIGQGTARFAINRRVPIPQGVDLAPNPQGPVDHSVAVLRVTAADGMVRAMVVGYACHNTTLDNYLWSGDYAGFTQEYLEKQFPGATAMFWMGCGGDANPNPRRTIELAQKHGKELADAVADVVKAPMEELKGKVSGDYNEIPIHFASRPREYWQGELMNKGYAQRTRAKRYLKMLDADGKIPDRYEHYPVQVWKIGDQLTWVALGGEVVVDYAIRLKKELAASGRTVWVTGYANDVMAYVPSLRVLREGGYEGDTSMIYYGQPGKWHDEIEEKIVNEVKRLAK